jgi:hypothetical protein
LDRLKNSLVPALKLARFPHSLAATLRSFTFYVGNPISSIPGS